ncbi:hypothetical protein VPIG_00031 [Vibrio phage PWH3a-P1]|uniref:hypothetical protein n=1 Tax=Vibrio phage PWH3a-P1 TaxID=754058 RepID=UPI0002C06A42|nr:hypothetical protein VPIG_00031 [Vibrio phage PWH3a-P1]AGH31889.1 hypothetical protein VPIG_00031 [Vibrio phage PWH3a-P1]
MEGWYSDSYSGYLYINNEAFYFSMRDTFCSETECEIERLQSEDLKQGDDWYTELSYSQENTIK